MADNVNQMPDPAGQDGNMPVADVEALEGICYGIVFLLTKLARCSAVLEVRGSLDDGA